jgi:hypothetical protein
MRYLPPDGTREEYCDLAHKTKPTLNQRLRMKEIQKHYPDWCMDARSVWRQQANKEAKSNPRAIKVPAFCPEA